MKASAKKSSTTTSTTATQAANEPFFAKANGGNFFAPATGTVAPAVQTKMAVNEPGDKFEQEADNMAEKVMRMPAPASMPIEEEELQRQPEDKLQKQEEEKIQKAALPEEKIQKTALPEEEIQKQEEDRVQKAAVPEEQVQKQETDEVTDRVMPKSYSNPPEKSIESDPNTTQTAVPDDPELARGINKQKAFELNVLYWDRYTLNETRPLRELVPADHPNAYANRTLESQRLMRAAGVGTTLIGKRLVRDGILGPRTLLVMRLVAVNPSMADLRHELAGLGVDLEALAADEAWGGAREALIDIRQPTFVAEWTTEGPGEMVIDNIVSTDEASTTTWFDEVLFGGMVPEDLEGQLSLGDRHEILRRAYETAAFRGRAGLVRVQRNFLDERRDVDVLVGRDAEKGGATHTVRFVAGDRAVLEKWEGLFGLTYPESTKVERAREEIVSGEAFEETGLLSGLLLVYYLPEFTDAERLRLLAEAYEYVKDRKEGIEGFVHPQGDKLVALLDDEDLAWYRFADRLEGLLRPFRGRPDLFDALAEYLRGHEQGDYFAVLIDRSETLRVIPTLALVVKLLLDSSQAGHDGTQRLIDRLQELKAKYQRHEYVTGDDPGVRLDKDNDKFLRVGEVAGEKSSVYTKEETRHVLKEQPRAALEAELEVQLEARLKEMLSAEPDNNPYGGTSEEEFGRMLVEAAAGELGLTEDDFKEVGYEESLRLNGVRSETIDGVEEFFVDFEVVSRIDGGEWEVLEPSAGYQPQRVFADRLFWYYFGNVAELIEDLAIAEMILVGGFVALSTGAMSFLVALAGGKTMVGLSIAISVLFYAITADRLTLGGFLKAVIEGYLGALGFKIFGGLGLKAAGLIGTATFKQKLIGLLLQTFITGAGSGALLGPSSVLVDDILRGELSSPTRYLKALAVGIVFGVVAEFIGTGVIAPLFRTAGRNVLEKIATIEGLKDFVEKAGKKIAPSVWLSDMTGGLSRLRQWLGANLDDELASRIFAHARDQTEQFLNSYLTGVELTIQRQALALAEVNLSRGAVEGLERLIRMTTRTADEDVVSDVLNQLVKKTERADPFLRLIEKADDGLVNKLTAGTGLNDLATADFGLTLAGARPGQGMANLLDLRFSGVVDDFDDYARRLLDTSETAQAQVLDVLATRGAAVTPESVLRIAQAGVELTDEVVGGLGRLVRSVPDVESLERLLGAVPDDQVGGFLRYAREAAPPDFDRLLALVKKGDLDERLFGLVDAPVGIRTLELVGELRAVFPALAGHKLAGAVKTLLDHGVSAADLRTIIRNVDDVLAHGPAADKLLNIQNFTAGMAHAKDVKQFDFMMSQLRNKGSQFMEVVDAISYATQKNRWHLFDAIFDAKVLGKVLPVPRGFPAPGDFTTFSKGIRKVMSEIGTDLDIRVQGSSLIDFPGNAVKDIDVAVMMNPDEFTDALKKAFFKEYRSYVKKLNDILPAGKQRPVPTGAGDVATKDFHDFVNDVRGMGSGDVTRRGVTVSSAMTSAPVAFDKGKLPDSKFLSTTKKGERRKVVESLKSLEEGGERTITGDDTGSVLDLSLIQAGKGFARPPFLQLKK
jgi:hypothetical protein